MNTIPLIPTLVLLVTLALVVWSYSRSRKLGKVGWLSWLQFLVLMAPWLIYFVLFVTGTFLSFAALLLLFVLSSTGYIAIGNQIRQILIKEQSQAQSMQNLANTNASDAANPEPKDSQTPATDDNSYSSDSSNAPNSPPNSLNKSANNFGNKGIKGLPGQLPMANPLTNPLGIRFKPIPVEDLKVMQGIFGIDTFYATETIPYQEGVIFRGNLRNDPEVAHAEMTQSLRKRFDDKYNLFLVEGQERKPVVIILPTRATTPEPNFWAQNVLVVVLILASIYTVFSLGLQLSGIGVAQTWADYSRALPFAGGLVAIFGCRELAMRLTARRYQIGLGLPFLLPSSQLGCFGAFSRITSTIPHRKALFDVAVAGPIASGTISFGVLLAGLILTGKHLGTIDVPSQIFQSSILVGMMAKVVLGDALRAEVLAIHPLTVLGWLGLVVTALNLMPAGQLDGGRIVQAVYGRRTAGWTTVLTLVFLAIATFINPLALYWGGLILILLRDLERPMLNELSELDEERDLLGLVLLFSMLIVILPFAPSLAQRFGIGVEISNFFN
jgi:membrane-associated protease RseP (regulator of RpoE activity)